MPEDQRSAALSEILKSSINSDDQVIELVEEKHARINHKEVKPLEFRGEWSAYTQSIKDRVEECRRTLTQRSYEDAKSRMREIKEAPIDQGMTDKIKATKVREASKGDRLPFSGDQLRQYFSEGVPGGMQ